MSRTIIGPRVMMLNGLRASASAVMQARVSRKLHDRIEGLPQAVRDIAWKGQLRMCHRYRQLVAAGKAKVIVITAIAREMVGFIWSIACTIQSASKAA